MGFRLHADSSDPPEVRGWRPHIMALIVSMGVLAMGYDTSVIGGTMALDSFRRDFDLIDRTQHERDTLQGNIISTFQAGIFETLGITGTDIKLFATGFYGVAKTLGMIIFSVWLVERLGRRPGLIWGAFVGSLPMWYLGGYVFKNDPATAAAAGEVSRSGAGYFAMVCVYLYGLIYCATWQGITWVYCSEIFPIDIRMLCVAITTADQWLWSFIISRLTSHMITSLGYGTYFFFATLMVLMGFWSYFSVIPETKGKTLEDMEPNFGALMPLTPKIVEEGPDGDSAKDLGEKFMDA
ncbi:hypothetical protein AC579_753 [Pseudocercospora musae]|uniref:Major facilitator superfamily (MFS) profile domain-containing protein n=1 Tax=Pseudocercospora musae TaxID=113226 RepID=A0A139IJF9_9PEZI|nr:hypothetical protein AC579_753 [Pseudocercospora musae]